ncbi:uncharacterized protein LOC115623759 [Scaptodrosophila lebanonensis]|uniref:Uncharacterized protein LOC115623759 n=1 Tax=Drosophila lebanonensis TaxID=7225 RepID=A0A6J2TDT3_DROLE|nr:uncharacterized protein LOC115623759 [Scaptodrosophila lebanonensis]
MAGSGSGSRYKVTARCVPEVSITSPTSGSGTHYQQLQQQQQQPQQQAVHEAPNSQQKQHQNNAQAKHFTLLRSRSQPSNSIFSPGLGIGVASVATVGGATLVEEEDFSVLTASDPTNSTNPQASGSGSGPKNVLQRQQATIISQQLEQSQPNEQLEQQQELQQGSGAIIVAQEPNELTPLVSSVEDSQFAAAASSSNANNNNNNSNVIASHPGLVSTTYSHNSKTTRSWPVIYRNPHHYDYEALYVQQPPTTTATNATAAAAVGIPGASSFKQNCYSNQFKQSIVYSSSNEELAEASAQLVGEQQAPSGRQTTCYYFAPSRHNSIYEHPSTVVGGCGSLQFDACSAAAATTAAAAAAVESLRRSNSILLRQNSCAKVIQRRGSANALDTPTSLSSHMDAGSTVGAGACCSTCCMGPPPVLFLFVTLLMTTSATAMLCAAIMTDHWEHVTWDRNSLDRYSNRSGLHLEWLLDEQVAMLKPDKRADHRFRRDSVFLVPMYGGIWTLCINLPMQQLQELRRNPKFPRGAPPCVNYLAGSMENARGEEQRNDWQHSESQVTLQPHLRMQNLSISCSLVCLIILGSAALVGAFGVCQRQISAILITGVMYLLAALFALFTLMIIHFKRQQGRPMLDSDYDGTVDGIVARPGGVAIMAKPLLGARIFLTSWSLDLGWGGVVLCAITSVLWILLSKIMRYNPFSALMI